MHRFIVYQYGKVGSTSLVDALNSLPDTKAFQSHFLGEAAFDATLKRLMDPAVPDYFFQHSSGQLMKNLRIYRHFLRRGRTPDPLTVITLSREPFDWFRSSISQDISEHLVSLKTMLQKQGIACQSEEQALQKGMELLFERLLLAIRHFGSVDATCAGRRGTLRQVIETADPEEFQSFMFFLNTFLRPHLWYHRQFSQVLEFDIREMAPLGTGVFCHRMDWGNTYLLRYEDMVDGFPQVMQDLGYSSPPRLPRRNESSQKAWAAELKQAFASENAQQLRALCHSEDTRFLGYESGDLDATA